MGKKIVRAAASLCLIFGVVAIFIAFNGGTVRLRVPFSGPAPDEEAQQAVILNLPHAMPLGIIVLILAISLFVLSKLFARNRGEEQGNG
mgnify:FL=1